MKKFITELKNRDKMKSIYVTGSSDWGWNGYRYTYRGQ